MSHQIRFRGELMGFFPSEEVAAAHLETHFGTRKDRQDFVVLPRGPVELRVNGNLVDTFSTVDDAQARADAIRTEVWENVATLLPDEAFDIRVPAPETDPVLDTEELEEPEAEPPEQADPEIPEETEANPPEQPL